VAESAFYRISILIGLIEFEEQRGGTIGMSSALGKIQQLVAGRTPSGHLRLAIQLGAARVDLATGDAAAALERLMEVERVADARGIRELVATARGLRSIALRAAGDLDGAEAAATEALAVARTVASRQVEIQQLCVLGDIATRTGRAEHGLVRLDEALELARSAHLYYEETEVLVLIAAARLALGTWTGAVASAESALTMATSSGYVRLADSARHVIKSAAGRLTG
jgi:ATP/maltotriose-dependent transcriptional regulator MalT